MRRTPVLVLAGVLATVAVPAELVALAEPAAGVGWNTSRQVGTGSLAMARLSAGFTLRTGQGSDGATFLARSLVFGEVDIVDLTNTGTVPVVATGTIVLRPIVSGTIEVSTCSLDYVGGSCPAGGTSRVLASAAGLTVKTTTVSYANPLAVGRSVHLRVSMSGGLANQAELYTSVAATRGPIDRSAG